MPRREGHHCARQIVIITTYVFSSKVDRNQFLSKLKHHSTAPLENKTASRFYSAPNSYCKGGGIQAYYLITVGQSNSNAIMIKGVEREKHV
jgi:hypothetical protein